MKDIKPQNEKYYHVYNRGVEKRNIFLDNYDLIRFLKSLKEFNTEERIGSLFLKEYEHKRKQKLEVSDSSSFEESDTSSLVDIICYCLNPNHFHLLLKQKNNDGISRFMHKLGVGYTNYFNARYIRIGALFQGGYKAAEIKSDEKLLEMTMYINGNHKIHGLGEVESWVWSSYRDYLGLRNGKLCNKKRVLNEFNSIEEYTGALKDYCSRKKQWKNENQNLLLE